MKQKVPFSYKRNPMILIHLLTDQPRLKRQYKRRNSDPATAPPPRKRPTQIAESQNKGRHNEPLAQHAVNIMYSWYLEHEDSPYPTKVKLLMILK